MLPLCNHRSHWVARPCCRSSASTVEGVRRPMRTHRTHLPVPVFQQRSTLLPILLLLLLLLMLSVTLCARPDCWGSIKELILEQRSLRNTHTLLQQQAPHFPAEVYLTNNNKNKNQHNKTPVQQQRRQPSVPPTVQQWWFWNVMPGPFLVAEAVSISNLFQSNVITNGDGQAGGLEQRRRQTVPEEILHRPQLFTIRSRRLRHVPDDFPMCPQRNCCTLTEVTSTVISLRTSAVLKIKTITRLCPLLRTTSLALSCFPAGHSLV